MIFSTEFNHGHFFMSINIDLHTTVNNNYIVTMICAIGFFLKINYPLVYLAITKKKYYNKRSYCYIFVQMCKYFYRTSFWK